PHRTAGRRLMVRIEMRQSGEPVIEHDLDVRRSQSDGGTQGGRVQGDGAQAAGEGEEAEGGSGGRHARSSYHGGNSSGLLPGPAVLTSWHDSESPRARRPPPG